MRTIAPVILLSLLMACHSGQKESLLPPWQRPTVLKRVIESQDPGRMVPANCPWYVTIESPAAWLDESDRDPLIVHLWSILESFYPLDMWENGAKNLGVTHAQMRHRYFGQRVAVVDFVFEEDHQVVVMSRAEPDDLEKLPGALGLSELQDTPRVGPYRLFSLPYGDKQYLFALGRKWLCITESDTAGPLCRALVAVAAGRNPLSEEDRYNHLTDTLPKDPDALMLTRSKDGTERHALTIVRRGLDITVDYAAESPSLKEMVQDVERIPGVEFGPMPASVMTALTFNMMRHKVEGAQALNFLLFPRNFHKHVRPYISPPVVVFLGQLPPVRIGQDLELPVPVLGVAVKVTDPRVTEDLDRIVKGVHFLLNASRLDLATGFFGVRRVQRDDLVYHVADLGPTIQKLADDDSHISRMIRLPNEAGLTRITFGRIADYYVICSQEAFFLQWRHADREPTARLTHDVQFDRFTFEENPELIASGLVRADLLGALLKDVADYWERFEAQDRARNPKAYEKVEKKKAGDEPAEGEGYRRPLRWIATGLQHRQSFSIQLWSGRGAVTRGRLHIAAEAPPELARE